MGGRPGDIFKIFQNGHIFLKFLFFKKIKKKKLQENLEFGAAQQPDLGHEDCPAQDEPAKENDAKAGPQV